MKVSPKIRAVLPVALCCGLLSTAICFAEEKTPTVAAPTAAANEVKINPALDKFTDAITFYASFDQAVPAADLSNGVGTPRDPNAKIEQRPGIVGQAFLAGEGNAVMYDALGNIDLSKPGSLAVWVSPVQWKRDEEETPYIFLINAVDQGRQLMLARMGNKLNKELIYAYAEAGGKGSSVLSGNSLDWKDGEWHLLVANWRNDSIEFSYDGTGLGRLEVPAFRTAQGDRGVLIVGNTVTPKLHYLLDELMVLNRPLEADEIKWMYEQMKPDEQPAGK